MTDRSDIVITGIGLACAAGESAVSAWEALLEGFSIADHARAAVIADRTNGGASCVQNRLVTLAEQVAHEAMTDCHWPRDGRTALVVGTSKGPADDWLLPLDRPAKSDKPLNAKCEDIATFQNITFIPDSSTKTSSEYGLSTVQTELAGRLSHTGPRLTVSAACASSLHALIRAAMLLQHGDADRAIVVGTESSLHPAFIQSFRRLGVLANPGEPCRPMDRNRTGFLISEAAAAICLERRQAGPGEIVLDGYAIGADASHLTHTNPDALALKSCLARVIARRPVDLIHAHATGTVANDAIELAAIESVLADLPAHRPILYSHKGAIGHSLGASGLVSTVLNAIAHRRGVVPGNVNSTNPLQTRAGRIDDRAIEQSIHRSIAIAAGFGGATGVVGLRTV